MTPQKSQDGKGWVRGLSLLAWISGEILGLTGAGLLLGYWITQSLGMSAFWSVLPAVSGLALAFYRIYKAAQALEGERNETRK